MNWRFSFPAECLAARANCPNENYIDFAGCQILHNGVVLTRITATANNPYPWGPAAGETGGFVEAAANLSQEHEAWVGDCAKAYGNAVVSQQGRLSGDGEAYGNAKIFGNGHVGAGGKIDGNTWINANTGHQGAFGNNEGVQNASDWNCCGEN